MRRATENLTLEIGSGESVQKLEGAELRNFLLTLEELETISLKLERRLRDARVVEILTNTSLKADRRDDFAEKENLQQVFDLLQAANIQPTLKEDEEHSAWKATYHDNTNAARAINVELAQQAEYNKLRTMATQIAKYNS